MLAGRRDEDEVVVVDEAVAAREGVALAQDLVDHRHGADLAGLRHVLLPERVRAADVDQALGEVDVAAAQRAQLAQTQPAVGGDDEDRAVPGVLRALGGLDLRRQRRGWRGAVRAGARGAGECLDLLRSRWRPATARSRSRWAEPSATSSRPIPDEVNA